LVPRVAYGNTSLAFVLAALVCLSVADTAISALDPWAEMARLARGLLRPDILAIEAWSVIWTIAFAVLGVSIGATGGLALAVLYPIAAPVRVLATVLRSIHELFWALLLIQIFGLGPTTGLLAIAIPYTGIFAKVKTYTLYRFECGLRSTLVLGFVGLPTIGFHLESYFKQGNYAAAAALLGVFYLLIGTRRIWVRPSTLPLLVLASILLLPEAIGGGSTLDNLARFLRDIVPAPLRGADLGTLATWRSFGAWIQGIATREAAPGIVQTLVLSQIALVTTAFLALLAFPVVSRRFAGPFGQVIGRVLLVIVRSTPEYMLAYVLLQLLGPSMLPAIIALAVHNGGIIGYLLGRHVDALEYRPDAPQGINLYAYETVPRLYGQFLAYLLYRWEIIVRESAIFGILGVTTLGYYVDAAISELRLDTAFALLLAVMLLSAAIDALSRALRRALRIDALPTRLSAAPCPQIRIG
jgi:phosphonate transport system permease protein